jgi:hypothetical protein
MVRQIIEDREGDWLRQSFMAPRSSTSLVRQRRQLLGKTQLKFSDSSLGGNYYINPVPQHTRFADIRVPGRFKGTTQGDYDGAGTGRYHSEAYDDNAQTIYLRFGVPEFNGLTTFWTGFYNAELSVLARTGRAESIFYTAGKALGFIAAVPLWPIILAGHAYRWAAQQPASKYYYLKPTMPLYWNAVNTMVNTIAVNMGIVPRVLGDTQASNLPKGDAIVDSQITSGDLATLHSMAPDIYDKNGGIDIYAVANRYTRMAIKNERAIEQLIGGATNLDEVANTLERYMYEDIDDSGGGSVNQILDSYLNSVGGSRTPPPATDANGNQLPPTNGAASSAPPPEIEERTGRAQEDADGNVKKGWLEQLWAHGVAEEADGSMWVSYRVNHTGTADESFSNSTRESDIMNTVNSQSSSARNTRFSFGNGNIGNDMISGTVEAVMGSVKDVISGVAAGVGVSGIAALWGSAFVDIPKQWDSSSFSPTTSSFTIELRSPYGNKLSRFNNLIVPLATLLAGVLPLSTGKHSYTSPFLCEMYSKGRSQTRLGIIDSMSIRRGVGNMGWTPEGECLGIDVTFTVMDLSSIMHMPIGTEPWFNPLKGIFDEDTAFNDYMAVLGGLGMMDQVYINRRLALSLTKAAVRFRKWTSPARYASWFGGTAPGKLISLMTREIDRP